MTRCAVAVLMSGLLLRFGIAQDASKGDAEKIQGTWKVISMETRKPGKKLPEERIKDIRVVITKDKLVFKGVKDAKGAKREATYKLDKLDPTKKPKWMDLGLLQEDGTGKPTGAIYELAGDDLKLCIGDPSPMPKRPLDFEVAERGLIFLVLKRDKN